MFTSRKRVQRRTTAKDLNRQDYLQALVTEFQETTDNNAKEQVLANLANFSYDPFNYEFLRDLHIVDLFIDCIEEDEDLNSSIVQFGMAGLCNLVADVKNLEQVIQHDRAISLVIRCLSSAVEDTVLSAITTLIQLTVPSSRHRIVTPSVIECMKRLSVTSNVRFHNLAMIFLEDCCNASEREAAINFESYLHIPLPTSK